VPKLSDFFAETRRTWNTRPNSCFAALTIILVD